MQGFIIVMGITFMVIGSAGLCFLGAVRLLDSNPHQGRHRADNPPESVPRWWHPRPMFMTSVERWQRWVQATYYEPEPLGRFFRRVEQRALVAQRKAELLARRARRQELSNWGWLSASVSELRSLYGPVIP